MEVDLKENIKWYHLGANFFAGMFLANVVPHFVNGISGNPFPPPFSGSPEWLSSPLVKFGRVSDKRIGSLIILLAGIVCQGVLLSIMLAH